MTAKSDDRQARMFEQTDLEKKFEEFHAKNPQVYREFVKIARAGSDAIKRLRAEGIRIPWRWSSDAILHMVRFNFVTRVVKTGPYKINNNLSAYYARLAMEKCEDLRGFFQIKVVGETHTRRQTRRRPPGPLRRSGERKG